MLTLSRIRTGQAMLMNAVDLFVILFAAIVGAGLILAALKPKQPATATAGDDPENAAGPSAVFLFRERALVDATGEAMALLQQKSSGLSDYDTILNTLAARFPALHATIDNPATNVIRLRNAQDPSVSLEIEHEDALLRLTLHTNQKQGGSGLARQWMQADRTAETLLMHDLAAHSTQLIWQTDKTGKLRWANRAYCEFAATQGPHFSLQVDIKDTTTPTEQRISIPTAQANDVQWFDVRSVVQAEGFLHFASDANALVRVDQQRQHFVQTLGKTFAQLSIGLAIFDKNRQLVMFNPALLELTRLPVDFLAARPSIDTVLDRLREQRMVPEPKNYGSWREQFTAVETAAKNGTYSEHWALPDGQTYRVTGRPHPDGAFAFLFEDISAEVSLTRRFRSDIETGQAVLDTLPDAIAVFSAAGTLVSTNRAYGRLWSTNADLILEHRELQSEISIWQKHCSPSPLWGEMRAFVHQLGVRKPWSDDALLDDGRRLKCHVNPIAGGMTMVRFAIAPQVQPIIRKLTMPDHAIRSAKR